MGTEGFKGVLLLTLMIASLMVPAISTTTVSAPSTFSASPEAIVIVRGKENAYNVNHTGDKPWKWYKEGDYPPITAAKKVGDGAVVAAGVASSFEDIEGAPEFGRWNDARAGYEPNPLPHLDKLLDVAFQWMVPGATKVLWYEGYNVLYSTTNCTNLINALKALGYTITSDSTEPITAELLAPYDILVIPQLQVYPSDAEVEIIKTFVEGGKGLFIAEGSDYQYFNYYKVQNKILSALESELPLEDQLAFQSDEMKDPVNFWFSEDRTIVDVDTTTEIGAAYQAVTGEAAIGLYRACTLAPPTLYGVAVSIIQTEPPPTDEIENDFRPTLATASPGANIVTIVRVSNIGKVNDSYTISVVDDLEWQIEVSPAALEEVPAGGGSDVTVEITVDPAVENKVQNLVRITVSGTGVQETVVLSTAPYFPLAEPPYPLLPDNHPMVRKSPYFYQFSMPSLIVEPPAQQIIIATENAYTSDETHREPHPVPFGMGEFPVIAAAAEVENGRVIVYGPGASFRSAPTDHFNIPHLRMKELGPSMMGWLVRWENAAQHKVLFYWTDGALHNAERLSEWIDYLRASGYTVNTFSDGITAERLAPYSVLMFVGPERAFTNSEIIAIRDWVQAGGGLFLGEQADYGGYSKPFYTNPILDALGANITVQDDQVTDNENYSRWPWEPRVYLVDHSVWYPPYAVEPGAEIRTVSYPAADVYAFSGYETGHSRSQLKFDIHSIPSGSDILSAKLWLYRLAADNWDGEILLNRVDDQLWDENITAIEFDAQTLTNEETRASKFISPGWDYLGVKNQLSVDHEAGHTYSSYRLRWANDNGGEPSVGIDDGRLLVIESELYELSIIFSSSEYNGIDPYLEVLYLLPHEWGLIEAWTGTIEAHFVWHLIQTWTSTVQAPAEWQLVESWAGTGQATSPWRLIDAWTGVIEAPALWQPIETWTGTIRTIGWKLIESWTGTVKGLVPVLLAAPSLISPADGTITDDNTPTFDWSDVTVAENYDLLVDDDVDFSSPEIQVTMPVSTYTPTDELPDDNYSWKVRARDAAGNVSEWSSIWTLLISAARGVDVFISPSYQSGLPGATLSYTVSVKNEGNISDTYALTATDTAGWGPTLSKDSLALPPKAYDTVTLAVTIPTDASVGDQDNITIKAESTKDPTVSDSARCMAQATAIRRRVEVSISPDSKSGPPGEKLTYTVTVLNEGDVEDTYDLTVIDDLTWGEAISPTSLTIAAGGSGTAILSVTIPEGTAGGTEDEITVTATSRANLTVGDSSTCIASAAAVRGVEVSISPETKSGLPDETLTYTVTVKNEGNVGDTYILSAAGAPDWSPRVENTSLTLNAGRAGETTLIVTIPTGASEDASITVTVTAISVGDPRVVGSGTCRAIAGGPTVLDRNLIVLLAISALLIGAAILTAAYLLYVRSKRAARRRVLRGPRRLWL